MDTNVHDESTEYTEETEASQTGRLHFSGFHGETKP